MSQLDADGDLIVERRPRGNAPEAASDLVLSEVHLECFRAPGCCSSVTVFHHGAGQLEIEHQLATPLELVGMQVWRGALLLGDYILHAAPRFSGRTILELGAGPGLAGLLAATGAAANPVFLTDVGPQTLQLSLANTRRNTAQLPGGPASLRVRQLDWTDPPDFLLPAPGPTEASSRDGGSTVMAPSAATELEAFSWGPDDAAALQRLDFVLAADCIYDNDLTEALMRTAVHLLRYARCARCAVPAPAGQPSHSQARQAATPRLLVALERRITFTLHDLDVRAPAYDFWRTLFVDVDVVRESGGRAGKEGGSGDARPAAPLPAQAGDSGSTEAGSKVEESLGPEGSRATAAAAAAPFPLAGRRLDLASVPQQLVEYERGDFLELWELWLCE